MPTIRADPVYLIAVLSLLVAGSEWLCRKAFFRHIGSALVVIIFAAVLANLGVIPAGSTEQAPVPVYDAVFVVVAPIAIFYLLLSVNLHSILKVGLPLVALFLVGSFGSVLGAVGMMHFVRGAETIGPLHGPVAGMFAGTYIGGSVNFNAIALEYGVVRQAGLYTGSVVVDNIVTAVWIAVTLAAPRLLAGIWVRASSSASDASQRIAGPPIIDLAAETETVDPGKVAIVLALGAGALIASLSVTRAFASIGLNVPSILVITTLALVLAQWRPVATMPGARAIGMYGVYLFLAVIGAFCDVRAMSQLGRLGVVLLIFASGLVLVHGVITFGVARIFRMDLGAAAVASQANVGGSTSALALAKSLGREDLLVPGILLGALGNAIGTFLGFIVVRFT
jgi:uncharacterized membrane protein